MNKRIILTGIPGARSLFNGIPVLEEVEQAVDDQTLRAIDGAGRRYIIIEASSDAQRMPQIITKGFGSDDPGGSAESANSPIE